MNYFKYLFVLAVGIVSSAFSQDVGDCISGIYSGSTSSIFPFYYEVEVEYIPSEVLFLVKQNGESFCTSYAYPKFQIYEDQIVLSSSNITSTGNIGSSESLVDDVTFTRNDKGACSKFEAKVDYFLFLYQSLKPERKYEKIPRRFSRLKRICDSLDSQEGIFK